MSQNKKSHEIQFPLTPLAAAITTAIAAPAAVLAQDEAEALALEEVIVTANKIGAMDVQSIPSSVQAIPEAMLQEMGARRLQAHGALAGIMPDCLSGSVLVA